MSKVVIKCFQTPRNNYFYDRSLRSVVAVTDDEYEVLKKVEQTGELPNDNSLKRFIESGLLRQTILEKIEHPETPNLKYLSEHCLGDLILQVTQQCNLRCNYCAYSGNYYNRSHTLDRMSYSVAKKAIDFFLERSNELSEISVSFYGGEPLLEYELIKKCVLYINERKGDRFVRYNMTTNGTLLTEEKFSFLVQNEFTLMFSLDGPENIHDANRKFISGKGSFKYLIENLKKFKEFNSSYYEEHVMFNSVISATTDLEKTYNFFTDLNLFPIHSVHFNYVNMTDIKDETITIISQPNLQVESFEFLKVLLALLGKWKWDTKSLMLREKAADIELLYSQLHRHTPEVNIMHHSGPCIVGVRRLFVDVNGIFFPCERVSENDFQMNIGTVENGFDYEKMDLFLNHGKIIENECLYCWNLRECLFCLGSVGKHNKTLTREILLDKCKKSKYRSEVLLQQVCVLAELGYRGNDNVTYLK